MAEATKLLARCRRNGIELRRHGEAIGIAAAFEIGEAMLDQVRELKPQLLALVRDAPPSRSPRLEAMLAAAAEAFAESGGIGAPPSGEVSAPVRRRKHASSAAARDDDDEWRRRFSY